MVQICRQFLHAFSVNSGVVLKKFFVEVSERCVKDFLIEVKELKTVFNVFIFCVLKSDASKF